ncbi:MAG: polyribonucleotide nucleotidyltransferase [Lentisphaeria bacterium]|nr:polyribonucleotide nucleotidyltransferase [Lentisphaeria bacterium]
MSIQSVNIDLGGGRELVVETGKLALLAGGSVTVRQGDTIVLVAACSANPRPGLDFFPLQVDYREKFGAAGKMPGGYFKREGRPSEKEILTARMTDRPLRPLFPKGYIDDVQIMSQLLSADGENEADVLSIFGASAALIVSDIPFTQPIGALRVGRVKGEFIANPSHVEMEESDLDLVYAGLEGKAIMIEGAAKEISEEVMRDALVFADGIVCKMIEAQRQLAEVVAKPKKEANLHLVPSTVMEAAKQFCADKITEACSGVAKHERSAKIRALKADMTEALAPQFEGLDEDLKLGDAMDEIVEMEVHRLGLEESKRIDGRGPDDLREIICEVGLLPRTHGSALFKRGDTQALVSITLAAESEAQKFDAITGGPDCKSFVLHYNFPNFSVGETGRIMGPGRREIGHGALAERSVAPAVPGDFGYMVRSVSEILGSNGSSSMASICGASLALMDAGVPIKDAVVGISVGLLSDDDGKRCFLVDILGDEDHFGDMDFKVAGTEAGITGFQLDLKIAGLDLEGMYEAMLKNKQARAQIREVMNACISEPRTELSPYAPKIVEVHINPEKIGALIGPGGKVIRGITETTGAQIDIEEDGTVKIYGANSDVIDAAKREVESVTAEVEVGKIYQGIVKTVKDFGAFVEILPGQDGLLHISEMADYRVREVSDICKEGDTITVKVVDVDQRGRIRLSRKAALEEM